MEKATALYCASISTPDATLRQAAEAAAAKSMHLAILLYAEFPVFPMTAYGSLPYASVDVPDAWPVLLHEAQTKLRDRTEAVESLLAKLGASADVRPLFVAHADIKHSVMHSTRTSDIAYFAPDLRERPSVFKEMVNSVLFHAPVPAWINGSVADTPQTVLLAWDSSLAGARAAHHALPFLKSARKVHIVCFDAPAQDEHSQLEPGREAAIWLSHHGCDVTLTQLPSGGREIGACILEHASEIGADLIVAGAYGRSRLQQAVFGGTSRTLIEQTKIAVLMGH